MWFLINDGKLVFNTMRDSAKGRARARDPRVAVCVDDRHPPFSFVQMQGVATTTEDRPGPSWLGCQYRTARAEKPRSSDRLGLASRRGV